MTMDEVLVPGLMLTIFQGKDSLFEKLKIINKRKRRPLSGIKFFQDESYIWIIYGILQVPETNITDRVRFLKAIQKNPTLIDYLEIFNRYFGGHIKNFNETVLSREEEIKPYIEFLNRMNAALFGGMDMNNGLMTLEQLAVLLIQQQGGIMRPLVNLFDNQVLYAKSSENLGIVELVRIAPFDYNGRHRSTIEYMYCRKKTEL